MKYIYFKIHGKEKSFSSFITYLKILKKHNIHAIFFIFFDEFVSSYYKSKSFYFNAEQQILFVEEKEIEKFECIYNINLANHSIRFEKTQYVVSALQLQHMIREVHKNFTKNIDMIIDGAFNFLSFKNKKIFFDYFFVLYKNDYFVKIRLDFKISETKSVYNDIIIPNYINKDSCYS